VYAATYEDGEAAHETSDYKKAVSIWGTFADKGDFTSQLKIAEMYRTGSGVK